MQTMEPGELRWFAIRTRSRFEKTVAASLRGKGYEEFLPLYRIRRQSSGRVREADLTMFPGYVFARFDPGTRLPILKIPGVVYVVGGENGPNPVDESEISAIRAVLNSGRRAKPWPFLKEGQKVRIDNGSLAGIQGILVDVRKTFRLVVSITLLQRSVAVEIDRDIVTPISGVIGS